MRIVLSAILVLLTVTLQAQMTIDKTVHDFGNLYANATTYVDFTFKNTGQSKTYLLSIDKPREVYDKYSTKTILPDSTVTIRLKINDNIKGKFNYQVDVYFSSSNQPVTLVLTGNVKERNNNPLTACPDFNAEPPQNGMATFEIIVKVVDSLTNEPIRRSKVYLVNNGTMIGAFNTNAHGVIKETVPLGLYYITAQKSGYKRGTYEGYMNFRANYAEIKLQQPTAPPVETEPELEIEEEVVEEPEIVIEEAPEEVEEEEAPEIVIEEEEEPEIVVEEAPDPVVEVDPPVVTDPVDDDTVFSSQKYAPNNIVFIVDVSSSMNQMGKMDLLKQAMAELTKILRPQDKVSLIAYSGSVNVLLEFESGANKSIILTKVESLKTGGYTAGGEAIKEGFRLAKRGYIEGGNNLIFMVTDGAFNKGSKDYIRTIEWNYKAKDIKFAVVGIKTLDYLTGHMTKISRKGGGEYVRILTEADAKTKLFEEVKRTSAIIH